MVKYFCDRCGKEVDEINMTLSMVRGGKTAGIQYLCPECTSKFQMIKDRLDNWMDFLKMSDEDTALMEYDFKVGDEVITSDGRIGIIDSICTCENCKKRGFYEPQVKMCKGVDKIYITDTDKKNGFSNFYKIGKYKFGNVDKASVQNVIDITNNEITRLLSDLVTYREQLKRMEALCEKGS